MTVAKTWRTFRHLRPEQTASRASLRLRRRLGVALASPDRATASFLGREVPPAVRHRPRSADGLLAGKANFHGREWPLHPPAWHEPKVPRLWRYQLHDFEYAQDLVAYESGTGDGEAVRLFERLAIDWIERNPPARGDGWHPYTVSMRLCAWARALATFGDTIPIAARTTIRESYLDQYAYVLTNPERDVLGNHLLENARALAVAGLLVGGALGRRGRRRARTLVLEQLPRQVLADGGHYERSPMYHLIVLGALRETVDALAAADLSVGDEPQRVLAAMARFGRAMLDAEGEPLSLGDSVPGEGPIPAEVVALEAPADRLTVFPESGYGVVISPDGRDRLVVDVGETCPAELPAHAHADTLSFVLERDGRALVVDPGVGEYAAGEWRDFARSTRAHSTIEVDGRDQSEVWASFRVGDRARPLPVRTDEEDGDAWIEGGHDGYRATPVRAVHRRRVVSHAGGGWSILDGIRSHRRCRIRSHVHLAPDLTAEIEPSGALVRRGAEPVARFRWSGFSSAREIRAETKPIQGWTFPRFGSRKAASVIVLEGTCDGRASFSLEIEA